MNVNANATKMLILIVIIHLFIIHIHSIVQWYEMRWDEMKNWIQSNDSNVVQLGSE